MALNGLEERHLRSQVMTAAKIGQRKGKRNYEAERKSAGAATGTCLSPTLKRHEVEVHFKGLLNGNTNHKGTSERGYLTLIDKFDSTLTRDYFLRRYF